MNASASSSLAVRAPRVLEWVRCGDDAGVDGLLHAQRIRAAGVLFVRVRDALRWAMAAVPPAADTVMAFVATQPPSAPALQGSTGSKLPALLSALRGARASRVEDSAISIAQYVQSVATDGWAGTGGVGAPMQGAAGPLSLRTLVGASRSVADMGSVK